MFPGVGLRDEAYDVHMFIELIYQFAVQGNYTQGRAESAQIIDARCQETCMVAGGQYRAPGQIDFPRGVCTTMRLRFPNRDSRHVERQDR